MITRECRQEIFEHLLEAAKTQMKVRRCMIEGCIFDMEKDIETMTAWQLISFEQEDEILEILKDF